MSAGAGSQSRIDLATRCRPPSGEILPWHGSADLAALAKANALVRLGAEAAQLDAGHNSRDHLPVGRFPHGKALEIATRGFLIDLTPTFRRSAVNYKMVDNYVLD